jgi:hypothetical protein
MGMYPCRIPHIFFLRDTVPGIKGIKGVRIKRDRIKVILPSFPPYLTCITLQSAPVSPSGAWHGHPLPGLLPLRRCPISYYSSPDSRFQNEKYFLFWMSPDPD